MEENSGQFGRAIGICEACCSLVVQSNLLQPSFGHILKMWRNFQYMNFVTQLRELVWESDVHLCVDQP